MNPEADRYNEGKPALSFNALSVPVNEGEALVWQAGAQKYERANWLKGVPYTQAADSLLRHLTAFLNGEDDDAETGLPHVDHVVCCAKILAHSRHTRPDLDDRSVARG